MATLTLEDIVAKTADLPTMPAAALAVMNETQKATCSAQSVARCLLQDQALSSRILRLANSSFYGMSRQVSTAQESVVILGMRVIRNLAIVASTYPWLQKSLTGYGLDANALWAHSFAVGVASQTIAERTRQADPSEAFVAGLLHNMGKLALNSWIENKIVPMIALCAREDLPFDAIERKVLGYDHADVGAHLAKSWNLPAPLTRAIGFHHRPLEAPAGEKLASIVHLADHFATSFGIGPGGDSFRYEFFGEVLDILSIPEGDTDVLAHDFLMAFERHEKLFEVKAA